MMDSIAFWFGFFFFCGIEKLKISKIFYWNVSLGSNIPKIDEKTIQYYKDIGVVLSRYRSGKLPKAFKLIPRNPTFWQEYLTLTGKNY